ncbi:hypothetical protein [Vibrio hyugaensis]|uniref:Uncharacterized protein n=1 Tax=Vibrio hyugaensis TaxID=1534743 RepID=A0ABQ5Y5G1_9VIBR|nr:hypothetical protein [Vibrio hyugaensis]GLR05817.1 hypothetical protein GCM10007906_34050 [Vibrio hyugaensis]
MKTGLLALAFISLNTYSASIPLTWSGIAPSIAQSPENVEAKNGVVQLDLYREHIELSVNNLEKEQITLSKSNVPVIALDL